MPYLNNWIPTKTLEEMSSTDYDVLIVWTGPWEDMHESCTCRMGHDPATSATNIHGQIHGVPGLFVADNIVLPT